MQIRIPSGVPANTSEGFGIDRDALLHELMNRAAPLVALAERMKALPLPEEHRSILAALYRSSRDVDRLVRSLRDPEDFLVPRKAELDVNALCSEIVDALRAQARAAGMRLLLDVGERARVLGDEVQLAEVVTNLVKNAIEAGRRGGQVVVSTSVHGRGVRVVVRDDGPGVAASLRDALFARGASSKATAGGAARGIGLFLSRSLARAHGGRLIYRRIADALGAQMTEFVLCLPRLRESLRAFAQGPSANDVETPAVLVVEDDPEVRLALTLILSPEFRVTAVGDGAAALEALSRNEFAALLTDEHLPVGPGGAALCRAAQALCPALEGRMLIVSGEARSRGADAFERALPRIRKPFDASSLRGALRERLATQPRREPSAAQAAARIEERA